MPPMPIISTETLASCAETRHTGTAETIAANKESFYHAPDPGASHPRQRSISTTDSGCADSFRKHLERDGAGSLTDRRAVLKGIAFVKSSNPSKTGRARRRRECTSDNPGCTYARPGQYPRPIHLPRLSSDPQCAGIAASIRTKSDLLAPRRSSRQTHSRPQTHCEVMIGG